MDVELNSALEELSRARTDASEGSLALDDVVAQARQDRDAAVQRRTKAEIELAKTRVELMQANSELLESIQQKVELSQQLEQWQVSAEDPIFGAEKSETQTGFPFVLHSDGHARADRGADEEAIGRKPRKGPQNRSSGAKENLFTSPAGAVSTITPTTIAFSLQKKLSSMQYSVENNDDDHVNDHITNLTHTQMFSNETKPINFLRNKRKRMKKSKHFVSCAVHNK